MVIIENYATNNGTLSRTVVGDMRIDGSGSHYCFNYRSTYDLIREASIHRDANMSAAACLLLQMLDALELWGYALADANGVAR